MRTSSVPQERVLVEIEGMTHDGNGFANVAGRTVYIFGALTGEKVNFRYTRIKGTQAEGVVDEVLQPSPERVPAACPQFGLCGGCSLQHQHPVAQIRIKQQKLLKLFAAIGKVQPERVLPPLIGDTVWGYRKKARLGVKWVTKKQRVLVGFRERVSGLICESERCLVLDPQVGELLGPLAEMIASLSIRAQIPQIEVAIGDTGCVLIFRVLSTPTTDDCQHIASFCETHGIVPYLQEGGTASLRPLSGAAEDLYYILPSHGVRIDFLPTDFTQVNGAFNRMMVAHVLQLLDPQANERVLDLFCGLGNFTLPLARATARVVGVEGDPGLVARAKRNARENGIDNAQFCVTDLYQPLDNAPWASESFDKILLDPPRTGAQAVLRHLPESGARRIVYVSCHPGTLARDAGDLVNLYGYRLVAAGVMDMFPHTAHVESIALFET